MLLSCLVSALGQEVRLSDRVAASGCLALSGGQTSAKRWLRCGSCSDLVMFVGAFPPYVSVVPSSPSETASCASFTAVARKEEARRKEGDTLWLAVKVWNNPAQVILDYVKKGSKIIVSGELQQETWTKDGVEKSRMALNCQNFTLLDSRKEGGGAPSGGGTSRPAARSKPVAPVEEEDIPF